MPLGQYLPQVRSIITVQMAWKLDPIPWNTGTFSTMTENSLAVLIKQLHSTIWSTLSELKKKTNYSLKVKQFISQDHTSEKFFLENTNLPEHAPHWVRWLPPEPTKWYAHMHIYPYIKYLKNS